MLAHVGRERDARGFEQGSNLARDSGAGRDPLAVIIDRRLLKTVKIAQHLGPFWPQACRLASVGQFLLEDKGKERAEDMTADSRIVRVEDRARVESRFCGLEDLLDLNELAVAQDSLERCDLGIGA